MPGAFKPPRFPKRPCGIRAYKTPGLAGVFALPRPAFDAFHRQHQAQRNLTVGRVILSASRASKQRPDIPPCVFCAVLRRVLLNEARACRRTARTKTAKELG